MAEEQSHEERVRRIREKITRENWREFLDFSDRKAEVLRSLERKERREFWTELLPVFIFAAVGTIATVASTVWAILSSR